MYDEWLVGGVDTMANASLEYRGRCSGRWSCSACNAISTLFNRRAGRSDKDVLDRCNIHVHTDRIAP